MTNMLKRLFLPALVALVIVPAFGQGATLADLLAGIPTTLKLKELDNSWRRIVIDDQATTALWLAMMGDDEAEGKPDYLPAYYTKGQLLTCAGVTYLLAYSIAPDPKTATLMPAPNFGTKLPAPAPESPLNLALLSLRSLGSIRDIRPLDPHAVIAVQPDQKEKSLENVLTGKVYSLQRTVGDLKTGWLQLCVVENSTSDNPMLSVIDRFLGKVGTYFTRGETLSVGGEEYVIAYARPVQLADLQSLENDDGERMLAIEPFHADTLLTLNLLNVRTSGRFVDVRPFDLQKSLAEWEQQRQVYAEVKRKAERENLMSKSKANLRQLITAVLMYTQDNDEVFPAKMSDAIAMQDVLVEYIPKACCTHPETGKPYLANPNLAGISLAKIQDPTEVVVFYEATPWPDGTRCVAFVDGHVEEVSADEWQEIKEKNKLP